MFLPGGIRINASDAVLDLSGFEIQPDFAPSGAWPIVAGPILPGAGRSSMMDEDAVRFRAGRNFPRF